MNKVPIQNKKPEDALLINKKQENLVEKIAPPTPPVKENTGINLIPNLSKEEVVKETKKKTLNMGAVISLMALVVVSILVVGFNIISKIQLNSEKEKLYNYEQRLGAVSYKITGNNEIRERISLYTDIQKDAFSPRTVIEYINSIASKSGSIKLSAFDFGSQLTFEIDGEAYSYEEVSKFWYLLSNDSKVESVILKSVGKTAEGVRFNFQGKLVFTDFISST